MRWVTLLSLTLVSGCSFLFTTSPPDRVTAYTSVDCTTSNAAPVIDGVLGVLNAAGTIYEVNSDYPPEYIAAGVGWTLLLSVSAIYGASVVSVCREAREKRDWLIEKEERRRWMQPQQQPYPPPQPYPPVYSPPRPPQSTPPSRRFPPYR